MKMFNKYMMIALTGVLAVGCNDLDTQPLGNIVTSEQKSEVLKSNPEMAEATMMAMPAAMKAIMATYDVHNNFSIPSIFLITDSRGMDMPSVNVGYNQFGAAASMADFAGNYYDNLIFWVNTYKVIFTANQTLKDIPASSELLINYRAQAYVYRAYAYWHLAQMYQFTYAANPDAPTVPLITDLNADEVAADGCLRAPASTLYAQIISDLTEAITLFDQTSVARSDKRFANKTVAMALRARVHLFMADWVAAANDAQEAINLAKAEGYRPYSLQEASVPAFYAAEDANVLWAIKNFASEPFTQGVVNFASMIGDWMPNGYTSVGVYRMINNTLYENIPASDVRKGWWLDSKAGYPTTLPIAYRQYIESCKGSAKQFLPYTQIKFGAAANEPGQPSGATDVPLVRIEEMYLTLAEAQGMQSPSLGASTLVDFVTSYRNPRYAFTASSAEELQDEVWNQRRLELWGEGMSYYDMMRLQKPMDRRGGGFPAEWVFNVAPDNKCLIYDIVFTEINANPLLNDANATNGATAPQPVPDVVE